MRQNQEVRFSVWYQGEPDIRPSRLLRGSEVIPFATGTDTAEMTGDITVNGITKPITFTVSLHPHDDPALKYSVGAREFVATGHIQRSAFNMTAYQEMVGDNVDIEIDAVVRKKL